jgi:hypothetical protein
MHSNDSVFNNCFSVRYLNKYGKSRNTSEIYNDLTLTMIKMTEDRKQPKVEVITTNKLNGDVKTEKDVFYFVEESGLWKIDKYYQFVMKNSGDGLIMRLFRKLIISNPVYEFIIIKPINAFSIIVVFCMTIYLLLRRRSIYSKLKMLRGKK